MTVPSSAAAAQHQADPGPARADRAPVATVKRAAAGALLLPAALLALLTLAALWRPLLPLDETRYAGVAWEMWVRGDWLVPHSGGLPYAHKPPLLFWLVQAGWSAFGVNVWWPRLVSPLCAAGTLALTAALARLLWPGRSLPAQAAPCILLASQLYTYFASALMVDALLTVFVALSFWGLLHAWRHGGAAGFAWMGVGLGGALLAKGPAALLHVLPVAVLAPWWMREQRPPWRRWATGVLAATLAAAAMILAWAVPAGLSGGAEYRAAIFWGQTAGRMANSFSHAAPWYTHAAALPLTLAPWFLWPRWWQGLRRAGLADSGLRFVLVGALAALLAFSAVSGKRLHYLLPEMVLFALLVGRALDAAPPARRMALAVPALTLALAGIAALAAPPLLALWNGPTADMRLLQAAGALTLMAAAALAWRRPQGNAGDVRWITTATLLGHCALLLAVTMAMAAPYDVLEVGRRLQVWQAAGQPLALEGDRHGQWTLAGRLQRPLQTVAPGQAMAWLQQHPGGRVIVLHRDPQALPAAARVEYSQPFRGGRLAILAAADAP